MHLLFHLTYLLLMPQRQAHASDILPSNLQHFISPCEGPVKVSSKSAEDLLQQTTTAA